MTMFKSVLVAIDGSDHASKALQIASDLTALYRAKLTVLHVVTAKKIGGELKHMQKSST